MGRFLSILPCLRYSVATLAFIAGVSSASAESSAVVVNYFRVEQDQGGETSLKADQFLAQIEWLQREKFHVLPVQNIVSALKQGRDLADHTVGLTFDAADRSVRDNALPILRRAGFTATIFVSPRLVDQGGRSLSWEDIRAASRDGFAIGARIDAGDIDSHTPVKTLAAINEAITRIEQETNIRPMLFSYPEGIADTTLRGIVQKSGFTAAFGLQSGPVSALSDPYMLPRFSMTGPYGAIERFRIVASSLPLVVQDVLPAGMIVEGRNPPQIGFTIIEADIDPQKIACFIEGQGRVTLEIIGRRVEIRPLAKFEEDDTTRMNCTVPASGDNTGRWHWLGFNFYVPIN